MSITLKLIKKAEESHNLVKEELVQILKDDSINKQLFDAADRIRKKYVGDRVHLRGLIEFSNICKRNCKYCGIRKDNKKLERYRLSNNEILSFAKKAVSYGYRTIVMQSAEDAFFSAEKLAEIIQEIKKLDVAITLSIGEMSYDEYEILKKAGADRFLLRIETTDKKLYEELNPKMVLEDRMNCLKSLKKLGYETGSGCMVGLPNQTIESLADDILFFKKLNADMIGIGPFIPNDDTPLKGMKGGQFELSLKVMALTRMLLPDINIPATTAMETLDPNGRLIALQSGANVCMPNVTEYEYKKKYLLYPGKICLNDTPTHCRGSITGKIESIGRSISDDYGFRGELK